MNDLAEVRQGWDFIRRWLRDQPTDPIADTMRRAAGGHHPASDVEGVFMCCASTRADDANQWRLYGGAGHGYTVGLRASAPLAAMARSDERAAKGSTASGSDRPRFRTLATTASVSPWLHVLYLADEKNAALDGLAANARADWNAIRATRFSDPEEYDAAGQEFADTVMTDLARVAQLMKSEGFAGENEVRVIVTVMFDGCSRFRPSHGGVVRYVRLTGAPAKAAAGGVVYGNELSDKTLPVQSVRLGPLVNAQNNRRTIEALLGRNGLKAADVRVSGLPLRL